MVRRFREGFNNMIPRRDLRLRVCLAGLEEGTADAAEIIILGRAFNQPYCYTHSSSILRNASQIGSNIRNIYDYSTD